MHLCFAFLLMPMVLSMSLNEVNECWFHSNVRPPLISEASASKTKKIEIGLDEASGKIYDFKQSQNNPVYIGDFSTVRLFAQNKTVNIYEGLMMRVALPAPHLSSETKSF